MDSIDKRRREIERAHEARRELEKGYEDTNSLPYVISELRSLAPTDPMVTKGLILISEFSTLESASVAQAKTERSEFLNYTITGSYRGKKVTLIILFNRINTDYQVSVDVGSSAPEDLPLTEEDRKELEELDIKDLYPAHYVIQQSMSLKMEIPPIFPQLGYGRVGEIPCRFVYETLFNNRGEGRAYPSRRYYDHRGDVYLEWDYDNNTRIPDFQLRRMEQNLYDSIRFLLDIHAPLREVRVIARTLKIPYYYRARKADLIESIIERLKPDEE